ncbi:hypothetical protein O181_027535 [Austropuccinia psidii MF-1]|uniref:Uncharacterized protein n=1 Tax=Austropuccinia psidii MF-1 TaxID=1389203 RepID=A0A9Q3CRJ5_9BASI|nr:hypothetical protein [Austropuccinia psidii MF-1]
MLIDDDRTASCIKVVRLRNPTIMNSNVDELNILTSQHRNKAFIAIQEETAKTYRKVLDSLHKEEWSLDSQKELINMNNLEVWDIV